MRARHHQPRRCHLKHLSVVILSEAKDLNVNFKHNRTTVPN
jgi:hypothetical protein